MNEPTITIAGNLTDNPQLRFTTSGQAVAVLRIASTPRRRDRVGNWADGNTTFLYAEAWGTPATNAVESSPRAIGSWSPDVSAPTSTPPTVGPPQATRSAA
jgi:single-strand DNA-binding protein